MPGALGQLGGGTGTGGGTGGGIGMVPTWMKLLLGGATAAGEVGNVMADRDRAKLLNKENQWANLTPQQLSAKVAAATQPLSAGLTQSVGNTVQAEVGERGLAESPGIFSAVLSQALAPYYQQNQNTALSEIAQQMSLPAGSASLVPQPANMAPLLALLLQSVAKPKVPTQNPGPPAGSTPTTFPTATSGGGPPDDWTQWLTPLAGAQ